MNLDTDLLAEISTRLDLREPNALAVRSVAARVFDHYENKAGGAPYECIVDSATGVGKTYVIAGLIEYFAGLGDAARNFLLLAPGRTIRNKSIRNFTPGDPKSLTAAMKSRPYLVTADNFNTAAAAAAMKDDSVTKLYIFTVQSLTTATGDGRSTHEFQEHLGKSFYEFLSGLDDLVVLADEQHCYRGKAFSATIQKLKPELVVGLTATPSRVDKDLIVYRYPLAAAIADQLVKTPVVVGRHDDRSDTATKLLDGVTLLRAKGELLAGYCVENDLPQVHPVMLVIAQSTDEADEYRDMLDSVAFDDGRWAGKALLVHSNLTGDDKEAALASLDSVEDTSSPVRIIISVGMLKEGWDVKNVYVIASMRASVSNVLTEQTLGRGMRLPFSRYTGVEMLDTVEVLAHERYSDLLKDRRALNEAFVDYRTFAVAETLADGTTVINQKDEELPEPEFEIVPTADGGSPDVTAVVEPNGAEPSGLSLVDILTRKLAAQEAANKVAPTRIYQPLPDRTAIYLPVITSVPIAAKVTLDGIDIERYGPFTALGHALTSRFSPALKRTKIVGQRQGDKVTTVTESTESHVAASMVLDRPLAETRTALIRTVMSLKGVEPRPTERGAAARIVDVVIDAMGEDGAATLSAFGDRCGQRLAGAVQQFLDEDSKAAVTFGESLTWKRLEKDRTAAKAETDDHPDAGFRKDTAFDGWQNCLYSHCWFDSSTEYDAARAIDHAAETVVWARLHINDLPITWAGTGREYNPDLVVIEKVDDKLAGWLVETKMNKEVTSTEVQGKRDAARQWARRVDSIRRGQQMDGLFDAPGDAVLDWNYLLLSEDDVRHASGSWEAMKRLGT